MRALKKLFKKKSKGIDTIVDFDGTAEDAPLSDYDLWSGNVPLVKLSYFDPTALSTMPFFSVLISKSNARGRRGRGGGGDEVDTTRLERVIKFFEWQQRPADEVLFAEGDVGNALWMVLEGTVAINKEVDSGSPPITLVELTGGKWFGEIALAGSQVRSASAVTTTPAIFLILTRQKFDELAMAMPDVAEEMKRVIGDRMASTLQQVPLFSVLPESTLNLLAGLFEFVQYRPDEVIFSAGEAGHDFYIVIAGSVKVGLNLGAADGTEKIFCTMGESEFFGEIALLHSCKRTASVTSVDNCTMLKLNRVQFERFRRAVPSMEGPFRREATMRLTRTLKRDCELFRAYWENPHAWSAERKATHSAAAIAAATAPPKKEGEKKKKGRKKTTILFRAKSKKLKEELAAAAAEEKATAAAAAEAQKNPAGDDDHLLSSLFESRQVSQGGMIAEHGADEPEFMVVVSGSAVCTVPSSASGASIEVRRLKKGDWIGDTLLLRRAERVESVRALEDTVLISLDAKNLALLTRASPAVKTLLEKSAKELLATVAKARSGRSAFAALSEQHVAAAASTAGDGSAVAAPSAALATEGADAAPILPTASSGGKTARKRRVSVWQPTAAEDGSTYFQNTVTGETAWEKPSRAVPLEAERAAATDLGGGEAINGFGDGWHRLTDPESGAEYMYHPDTHTSKWVEAADTWHRHIDEASGFAYLVHSVTGETKWEAQ